MKNLKFLSFMLFAIMSVSLISCGDDDEIGGRDTLVGKWQCTWSEGYEKYANNPEYNDEWNEEGDFTVTFNEDGTVVADGDTVLKLTDSELILESSEKDSDYEYYDKSTFQKI